jgi:2-oxoisovalerate dehydrogenase E1 component alpha subunit
MSAIRTRLHVPQAPARPGEKPDFSYVKLSPAGAVGRPDPAAPLAQTEHLANELVRVLGDDHRAVGPWDPHLAPSDLELGLRHMMLTRVYDDRMHRAQRQGRTTFYIKSTGEEAVSVAAGMALRPTDMLFPGYRNQGLQIVRGQKLVDLMCQILSNSRDMCKGRQLPVMYHSKEARLFSISGNLATQFPQAVGWAMAAAIKNEDDIAATWLGDGSTAGSGLPLRPVVRAGVSRAGHPQRRQQPVGDLHLPGLRGRRAQVVRGARARLRHSGHSRRRQRLPRGVCGHAVGCRACAHGRGTDADRARDLPCGAAFDQ